MSSKEQLHVIFLPYMAPGHMMPMVDSARLFAAHDVRATIITTPMNAQRFKTTVDREIKAGRHIALEILPFPSVPGLPQGCENLSDTPTPEMSMRLFRAINLLQPQIESLFRAIHPDCIFSDVLFHWTVDIAIELGIPRLAFSGSGFFNLSVAFAVECHGPHKNVDSESESFLVPSLPNKVSLTGSQLPDIVKTKTKFSEMFEKLKVAERKSFGMVVNSFDVLESAYADYYRKAIGIKAWGIGPVSLFNQEEADKAERGDMATINRDRYLNWLNLKGQNSVLYVCFGSLTRFNKTQLAEIAGALEDTHCSFIWVVPKVLKMNGDNNDKEEEEEWWLPDGFEERTEKSGKGMVVKGWAPQVLILEHPSIGGFLTHCGWNSILEGVTTGVPMVTWPTIADQFFNEKLVTQVLEFGVPVGNEYWKVWATEETPLIGREKISSAVNTVMNGGKEAEEMRSVARRLSESAKKAVEEGGSSYNDLKTLIQDIKLYRQK